MIRGGIIADVGSDHAYLPIWLCLNNKIKKAYALDISENCVKKIKANLKKYNISQDIIIPVLSDGLACFEPDACHSERSGESLFDFSELTDIIIAGMGGTTIAEIIDKIEKTKNINAVNFILQSNSKTEVLRKFLYKNKFDIIQEVITENKNRIYSTIQAKFTGATYNPTKIEILIGKNIHHAGYINKFIKGLYIILKDLDKSGGDKYNIKTEFGYYEEIKNLISELELKKL